jgi:hypothetical protein
MFTGSPRLLIRSLPWALAVVVVKWLADVGGLQVLDLNPLLTGAIASEVFIIGFLLNGTSADFKEAERLPGELAASMETIADECLIIREEQHLPEAQMCLADLLALGRSIQAWLSHDRGFDEVMGDIRALNGYFSVFAPKIQAGFTGRLKTEQSNIRKTVLRMDTMRRTSYVSAGYLIAEVIAAMLGVILVLTDLGPMAPALALVGLIAYLVIYMLALIRDLDNPYEYLDGKPGAADVSLDVLQRHEERIKQLLADGADEVAQMPDQSPPVPEAQ